MGRRSKNGARRLPCPGPPHPGPAGAARLSPDGRKRPWAGCREPADRLPRTVTRVMFSFLFSRVDRLSHVCLEPRRVRVAAGSAGPAAAGAAVGAEAGLPPPPSPRRPALRPARGLGLALAAARAGGPCAVPPRRALLLSGGQAGFLGFYLLLLQGPTSSPTPTSPHAPRGWQCPRRSLFLTTSVLRNTGHVHCRMRLY